MVSEYLESNYPYASEDSMSNRLRRRGAPKRGAPEIIRLGRVELEGDRMRDIRDSVQQSWDVFHAEPNSAPKRWRVSRILRGGAV